MAAEIPSHQGWCFDNVGLINMCFELLFNDIKFKRRFDQCDIYFQTVTSVHDGGVWVGVLT